ncbi:hypothetical protein OV090_27630 [Nannocystis sp. RBIL2]|uniref:hypothetical protein n=1 Tax=Nannocystis sp. RBIL2 TaxID=2996788 RepID=UPI00226D5056|nr:hypothetical protein [Nannocystis sp. RBIL2]
MNDAPRTGRSRLRKIGLWCLGLAGTGMVLGAGTVAGVFWYYGRGIEGIDVAAIRDYRPPQVTRIVSRDGVVIGEIFSERRTLSAMRTSRHTSRTRSSPPRTPTSTTTRAWTTSAWCGPC